MTEELKLDLMKKFKELNVAEYTTKYGDYYGLMFAGAEITTKELQEDLDHKKIALKSRKARIKELEKDKEMLKSDLNNAYITVGKQSREIERQADVIKELEDHVRELESGACSCCAEDWKNKKIVKLNEEKIELKELLSLVYKGLIRYETNPINLAVEGTFEMEKSVFMDWLHRVKPFVTEGEVEK